ncbi:MAG: hypothetical protein HC845_09415 [Akkermansiaceae bacterium]|nr:hypothetical protein [Akkermansiaceae bacterium]
MINISPPIIISFGLLLIASPVSPAVQGGYFGNGVVKGSGPAKLFYNSIRFNVKRNGKVTGSAVSFSTGISPVKKLRLRGEISNIQRRGANRSAKFTAKLSDGATLSGKVFLNGGVKSARGKIRRAGARGNFYGDGAGGSIVYEDNGDIAVMNLRTGNTRKFPALPFTEGGASVSRDGTIAHLRELTRNPEGVLVRFNKLDGTFIREFVWEEPLSFVRDGARISPDGKFVAFCLRVPDDRGGNRIYVFETAPPYRSVFWEAYCSPGWTTDNRLIAVADGNKQINRTGGPININNPGANILSQVAFLNLPGLEPEAPEGAPDGSSILFSDKSGVAKTFSMNVNTGAVTQILTESTGQFHPIVGGNSLFFVQACCTGIAFSSQIHHVPLNLTRAAPMTIGGYFLEDAAGDNLIVGADRYGYTPASQ